MLDSDFSVSGFQETPLVPILQNKGSWLIPEDGFESRTTPTVNIYHTGQ